MKYVTQEDLLTIIQGVMLSSSLENDNERLNLIESLVIDEVKTFLSPVYQTEKIFADPVLRHGLLVRIIAILVVYRSVRRNAARKVPEDLVTLEAWAYEMLEKLSAGQLKLGDGIPPVTNEDGTMPSIFGSNRKKEYYF